ncbi:TSC22 domain family protein 1-like isoform X1 [Cheilinus undulatus]|uniref:TSC22 domain family protein 1-like isoform X1 n=1 Tax=Cheilinus undulatus TaxID=241271 RepID=UPI001BD459F0|nr:TSC22 domain family protein 1-like isoform X1 [Cheilinus undulatus]XP_041663092.1 TSC22 domain family protein 1-like isoform X1 [Cheilinus undulatus]
MHHPDPAGDSGSVRKMAHPAVFHRRGSNTGSGSGSSLSTPANPVVDNSHVPADDYQPSLLIQCQPPAGSSSPGPHHIPPHSLNLLSQPQATQSSGAQIKKKSGFQITSVTPAQISVSTNNSIAEDTESYDDLDESHTEDLSSSEILDVSLSRANDIVGAERSSSEETLNNFHDAETPGAVSPNQPSHPHALNQVQHHSGAMVNGTVNHQHHHHPNHTHVYPLSSGSGSTPSALASGALPCVTPKMPSNVGVQENVSQVAPPSIIAQSVGVVAPGSVPGMHDSATGTTVSIVNPQTNSVSNANRVSSANVPVKGGISMSASSSSGGFPPNVISSSGGSSAVTAVGNLISTNVSIIQQQQNMNSNLSMTTTTNAGVAAVSASGGMGLSSGIQGRVGSVVLQSVSVPVTAVAAAPIPSTPAQPALPTAPVVATTSSRFRVVKLDSSSEPFKKGRWTCTEFYDKEIPASAPSSSASDTGALSMRHFVSESFAGASERESTSGSSVSSTMSTLSHYTESVCSGEAGGPQNAQDYAPPPQGFQGILPSGLSMGVSQTQPHMHLQDITHSHVKTTVAPSAPTNVNQPAPMSGHQTTLGLCAPAVHQQQLTYAQAVANQSTGSTQGVVGVQQQKMGYASMPQQPTATPQAAPVQVRQTEYTQAHQGMPQAAASLSLSNQAGSAPPGPGNGACHMVGGLQQTQALVHTQPQQPTSLQAPSSSMPSPVGVPGLGQQPQSHPGQLDIQQQKPQSLPPQNQNLGMGTQLPTTVHQSQVSASSVLPPNSQNDPQTQNTGNGSRIPPQSVPHSQPSCVSLSQDPNSAQALAHAAQASALYASLPTFTTTQLQDAQRLLLQHQSALLGLPKLSGGEAGTGSSTGQGQEAEGNAATASALTASSGLKAVDGEEDGSSGASVVAIDNKIEQAMDLVKSHLMYAVREEVEVLKEQIKELIERNSQLEQENTLLKTLASPEQMAQFQAQVQTGSPPAPPTAATPGPTSSATLSQPALHSSGPSA